MEEKTTGYIQESLGRNNKTIRADRAESINEDLEMVYKRAVEDKLISIKKLQRKQLNAFDFSPTNSMSLAMGKDIDASITKDEDLALGLSIHNETVKLNIAKTRYNFLFGKTYEIE